MLRLLLRDLLASGRGLLRDTSLLLSREVRANGGLLANAGLLHASLGSAQTSDRLLGTGFSLLLGPDLTQSIETLLSLKRRALAHGLLLSGSALLGSLARDQAHVGSGPALTGHESSLVGHVRPSLLRECCHSRVGAGAIGHALQLGCGIGLLASHTLETADRRILSADAA